MRHTTINRIAACVIAAALAGCAGPAPAPAPGRVLIAPGISSDCARAEPPAAAETLAGGLNPAHIRLLSWNIYKSSRNGWAQDFDTVTSGADLVVLQEAALEPALLALLHDRSLAWQMGTAFHYKGQEFGVLTAARAGTDYSCSLSTREPLLRIPKQIMVSRHPIAGHDEALLLANVHLINFTVGTGKFRAQVDALAGVLAAHAGPVIVVGDFNTWNATRQSAVDAMARQLGLQVVHFDDDQRVRFLGKPVDHVLYRGLVARDAVVHPVTTSDHNPVAVDFALAPRA